ncbi:hypothetical protein J6590_061839 [Homalodisca vitripennis]|nr:hypothetical protein J6590_061839 [Homalodisca vitripennis]
MAGPAVALSHERPRCAPPTTKQQIDCDRTFPFLARAYRRVSCHGPWRRGDLPRFTQDSATSAHYSYIHFNTHPSVNITPTASQTEPASANRFRYISFSFATSRKRQKHLGEQQAM